MKRNYLLLLFLISIIITVSCTQKQDEKSNVLKGFSYTVYEIYPTTNMWNFIELNSRNGKMWLVQYSIDKDENRFVSPLNNEALVSSVEEVNGRFKLQPTQNIYTFILLDQINGKTWQVQWSFKEENRFVIPIEEEGLN
jgi:hypothetical protein